jgi:N-acetylgalactosamine kinase
VLILKLSFAFVICFHGREWKRSNASVQWRDYVCCGLRGCLEASPDVATPVVTGLSMLVSGNVPIACGVSSSSALVIASALVGSVAWGVKTVVTRVQLAEACARAERYVGTEGGGMDQAISLLGERGAAKLVEFNPLRTTSVKLPPGATFVVCNSMVTMEKAATAEFNTRVVECRLASQVSKTTDRRLLNHFSLFKPCITHRL